MPRSKLSKRELVLISILAVSILSYLYLNLLLFPSYTRINKLTDELRQKRIISEDREAAFKKLAQLDNLLKAGQLQLENIEKNIPSNVRLPELIVNIDEKVKELGMSIKSIYIGDVDSANKEYGIIPINIAMEGKFDDIMSFIKYIEDSKRIFVIDSFVLAPKKRTMPIPFSISIRTFVLRSTEDSVISEDLEYPFLKNNNGKSYPFLER